MSAALAARASAESGRNALKLSQQVRLSQASAVFKGDGGSSRVVESRSSAELPHHGLGHTIRGNSGNPPEADGNPPSGNAIEDAILRTQRALNKRMQQQPTSGSSSGHGNSVKGGGNPNPNPNPTSSPVRSSSQHHHQEERERRNSFEHGRRGGDTPTSGRSQKLSDVIQIANQLYGMPSLPPSHRAREVPA